MSDELVRITIKYRRNYRMQDQIKRSFYDNVTKLQLKKLKKEYPDAFLRFKDIVNEVEAEK